MKGEFNCYDASNSGSRESLVPSLHLAKSGVITFNRCAVEVCNLKEGDQLRFHQSKRLPKEWYFEKVKEGGLRLRKGYGEDSKNLMLNSAFTIKALMKSINKTLTLRIQIGREPDADGWWSLITSAL